MAGEGVTALPLYLFTFNAPGGTRRAEQPSQEFIFYLR